MSAPSTGTLQLANCVSVWRCHLVDVQQQELNIIIIMLLVLTYSLITSKPRNPNVSNIFVKYVFKISIVFFLLWTFVESHFQTPFIA